MADYIVFKIYEMTGEYGPADISYPEYLDLNDTCGVDENGPFSYAVMPATRWRAWQILSGE